MSPNVLNGVISWPQWATAGGTERGGKSMDGQGLRHVLPLIGTKHGKDRLPVGLVVGALPQDVPDVALGVAALPALGSGQEPSCVHLVGGDDAPRHADTHEALLGSFEAFHGN